MPALQARDGDESALLTDLDRGEAQLWVGARAAMVTQLIPEPDGLCVHAWLAGGYLGEIVAMVPGMEAWARARGCHHATVRGRKGWSRALAAQGYVHDGDELKKVL